MGHGVARKWELAAGAIEALAKVVDLIPECHAGPLGWWPTEEFKAAQEASARAVAEFTAHVESSEECEAT